jgi:hypothetical protein
LSLALALTIHNKQTKTAQQLEKVQHELQQARQLNESMQAKILKLAAAAEMQRALLAGKLEEDSVWRLCGKTACR